MTNFSIGYNPYLVSCLFKKNGKLFNEKSKIGSKSNERLQILLGESGNWKGLPVEIASACDDDEVMIPVSYTHLHLTRATAYFL